MVTIERTGTAAFAEALVAADPAPEIPEADDLYGWLVGSWELAVDCYVAVNLTGHGLHGEVHFSWVLEGRAIQDTWIMPRRIDRTAQHG